MDYRTLFGSGLLGSLLPTENKQSAAPAGPGPGGMMGMGGAGGMGLIHLMRGAGLPTGGFASMLNGGLGGGAAAAPMGGMPSQFSNFTPEQWQQLLSMWNASGNNKGGQVK